MSILSTAQRRSRLVQVVLQSVPIFYEQPVTLTATEVHLTKDSASFKVSVDTMHSWESDNNAIMWQLHVGSDIAVQTLPATRQGNQAFSFTLSHEPHSFSGKLITLAWAVEAVCKSPNHNTHHEFVLSPQGKEIRL